MINIAWNGRYGGEPWGGRSGGDGAVVQYTFTAGISHTHSLVMSIASGKTVTVDWGDGSTSSVTGSAQTVSHLYATGTFTVKVLDAKYVTSFKYYNPASSSINPNIPVSLFSRLPLTTLELMAYLKITDDVRFAPKTLTTLNLSSGLTSGGDMVGDIKNIPRSVRMFTTQYLYFFGDLKDWPPITGELYLRVMSNYSLIQVSDLDLHCSSVIRFVVTPPSGFGLSTEEVDLILNYFSANSIPASSGAILDLRGDNAYRSSASDAAITALTSAGYAVSVNGRVTDGVYTLDAHGNRIKTTPGPRITCLGDSLTNVSYYCVSLASGTAKTVVCASIGGDTSTHIRDRFFGHVFDESTTPATAGTVRLKTRRCDLQRTYVTSEGSTQIAEPRFARFYNDTGTIGTSWMREYALVRADGTATLVTPNNPFTVGQQVYFKKTALTGITLLRPYFVVSSTENTLQVSASAGGSPVEIGAGTGHLFGGFYYEWAYTNENTNIGVETYTDFDEDILVIWAGQNNQVYPDVVDDIQAMIDAISTVNKRFVVLSTIPRDYQITGTAGNLAVQSIRSWLSTNYPDNYFDVYAYLQSLATADPGDIEDVANGVVPRSLRSDSIHLNSATSTLVGTQVANFITAKGW